MTRMKYKYKYENINHDKIFYGDNIELPVLFILTVLWLENVAESDQRASRQTTQWKSGQISPGA